ncbi:MAG: hypothetical protein GY768_01005 [Planctomycetaceae bacterium]|nr:hypothetical protein [Planctomycetaceae bacterium]
MTRRIITLTTLSALTFAIFAADASAGCGGRRHSYHHHIRHIRPTRVVRPIVHHRVAPPQVAIAPPLLAPEPQFPMVPSGSTITIPANFLGNQPGSVLMVFNNIKLPVRIDSWTMTGVTVTLPPMAIKESVVIRLDVLLPQGQLGRTQQIRVTAPAPVVLHPTAPTSPLPTNPALQAQNQAAAMLGG